MHVHSQKRSAKSSNFKEDDSACLLGPSRSYLLLYKSMTRRNEQPAWWTGAGWAGRAGTPSQGTGTQYYLYTRKTLFNVATAVWSAKFAYFLNPDQKQLTIWPNQIMLFWAPVFKFLINSAVCILMQRQTSRCASYHRVKKIKFL